MGAGDTTVALWELRRTESASSLGRLRVRAEGAELDVTLAPSSPEPSWEDALPRARAAWVMAAFAEKLRASYWVRNLSWDRLAALHESLPQETRDGASGAELGRLIHLAARLDTRDDRFQTLLPLASMGFDHVPGAR